MNASSSRARLRTALEATFGDNMTATGRRLVRFTGESLSHQMQFEKSKEIRADRQYVDTILVGVSAQGGINFEAVYREYDLFLESALQSTFSAFGDGTPQEIGTPSFAANSLTQVGGTDFSTLAKGQWFQIRGCTGPSAVNNGWHQVSLTTAPTATVITTEDVFPFTAGAATGTVTVSSSRLTNGTDLRTHVLEVEFSDAVQFLTYRGMGVNKMSLALASKAVITGSFDFMGKDALPLAGATNLPAGADDAAYPTTYEVMNATGNVARLLEGGAVLPAGVFVKSLSLDLDNALRAQDAIANASAVGLGNGSLSITGKMTVYFSNATLYNKAINNQLSAVAFSIMDGPEATGNGYMVTLPQIEYGAPTLQAGGLDQDLMVELPFTATMDPVSGKMILIDRAGD